MPESYETSQDPSWANGSDTEQGVSRPSTVGAILAGGLALVGGGLLAAGPYLPFVDSEGAHRSEIELVIWPKPLLLVVLAGLVCGAGLLAMIRPRTGFGTAMLGLAIAPAATVGALQAPSLLRTLLSSKGRDGLELGGWLLAAGTGIALLAALVAFMVTVARFGPARGSGIPVLGAVAAAGLLQWWSVSPVGPNGDPLIRYFEVDTNGSVWPGVVALSALALIISAVTMSSARCGAAAIGTAFGATLAVGLELGARYMITTGELRRSFGMELRTVPVMLTGVTAGVLLLTTISLVVSTTRLRADTTNMALVGWEQAEGGTGVRSWTAQDSGQSDALDSAWGATSGKATAAAGGDTSWASDSSSTGWPEQ